MEWFIQHRVLHGTYRARESIPEEIHSMAAAYEGFIPNCTGWNMPITFVAMYASPTSLLRPYLSKVDYMIIYPKTDLQTKKHELLHARYAMESTYRQHVQTLWNALPPRNQERIRQILLKMGYPDRQDLLLDEFQAYYYTEKPSFFGIGRLPVGDHPKRSKRVPGKGK